jgi:aspartate aminotransferase
MKALEPDAGRFCEMAKKYDLLLVPSDSFGCPGYVRISYCVDPKRIEGALPLFQKLMDEYKGEA